MAHFDTSDAYIQYRTFVLTHIIPDGKEAAMPRQRCRATGCGRFVAAGTTTCARHTETPTDELGEELAALRTVLGEVMTKVKDAEIRARLVPRLVSVAIQARKAQHQLGSGAAEELMAMLAPVLEELDGQ